MSGNKRLGWDLPVAGTGQPQSEVLKLAKAQQCLAKAVADQAKVKVADEWRLTPSTGRYRISGLGKYPPATD